jgi:hypothetical protein
MIVMKTIGLQNWKVTSIEDQKNQRGKAATKEMNERIPQQTEIAEQTEAPIGFFRLFRYFRLLRYSLVQSKILPKKQEFSGL